MHPHEKSQQVYGISKRLVEMARDAVYGPQHRNYFCQRTPIHHMRKKWPSTMYKFSSTLWHPLHWTDVYILGCIPKSLARTQQMCFTYIGSKITGLKWDSKLITQIWKLIYGQCLHHSKHKHAGEMLEIIPRNWSSIQKSHMNMAEDDMHYPTVITHISTHTSPSHYTPWSQNKKPISPHQDCSRDNTHRWTHSIFLI